MGAGKQRALVTGASSGIGRAVAIALAANRGFLCLVGRDDERLGAVASEVQAIGASVLPFQGDLVDDATINDLAQRLSRESDGIDVLVHCAGAFASGSFEETPVETLDALYRANVRAPYALTRAVLPLLVSKQGQIVFVNSSQGLQARGHSAAFASTQHALRAITDSLRQEINAQGVRVLSVYPGRTATPRMAKFYELRRVPYHPEMLLQPDNVAQVVMTALQMPRTAEITNIELRPSIRSY